MECAVAGEHLIYDRAAGEDVGARVRFEPAYLLGRHVAERSKHGADGRLRTGDGPFVSAEPGHVLGQPEVEDLRASVS